jgi:hypothetical protein
MEKVGTHQFDARDSKTGALWRRGTVGLNGTRYHHAALQRFTLTLALIQQLLLLLLDGITVGR